MSHYHARYKSEEISPEEFDGKHRRNTYLYVAYIVKEWWVKICGSKYCILISVCLDFIFSFIALRTTFHVCPGSPFKETNYSQSVYQS